jgi:hypothetical protein
MLEGQNDELAKEKCKMGEEAEKLRNQNKRNED